MSKTKKPLPVCGTGSGEDGQLSLGEVRLPKFKSTTQVDHLQEISSYLLPGERNALPLSHLVKVTGLDARTVRQKIQRERFSGAAILSNCRTGYFLATSEEEKHRCVRSMIHRSAEIRRAAQAIATAEVVEDG